MRIVIDSGIPFLDGVFPDGFEVLHLPPEEITSASVQHADALFVRTRTRINRELLAGSKVRFVATATIGFDHIDQVYCRDSGVHWISCPGCNAQAVCDYVQEAIISMKPGKTALTIGVVGYGHVGKLVAAMAQSLGHNILLCDPPLGIGQSLEDIAPYCDVLTFHTPLTVSGKYSTFHMCDHTILNLCKSDVLIINTARGGVLNEQALLCYLHDHVQAQAVIDCWEGEPMINQSLLERADLASFHIAGYSIEGKMKASEMCLHAFCEFFSLPILSINKKVVPLQGDSKTGWIRRITDQLKVQSQQFEQLRKQYKLR